MNQQIEKISDLLSFLNGLIFIIFLAPFTLYIWCVTLRKAKKDKEDGLITDDNWINDYI